MFESVRQVIAEPNRQEAELRLAIAALRSTMRHQARILAEMRAYLDEVAPNRSTSSTAGPVRCRCCVFIPSRRPWYTPAPGACHSGAILRLAFFRYPVGRQWRRFPIGALLTEAGRRDGTAGHRPGRAVFECAVATRRVALLCRHGTLRPSARGTFVRHAVCQSP